jgi:type I restriction enzyme S subunit
LQRLATLVKLAVPEERPTVTLESVGSGTMRLLPQELPIRSGLEPGLAAVEPGDVLLGKLRPYLGKTWRAEFAAHASTELMCLRAAVGLADSRWLAYLVASQPVIDWATATSDGAKMPRTGWERLRLLDVDVPPLEQQRMIADLLDTETARVDELLERRIRTRSLLEELDQAALLRELGDWRSQPMISLRQAGARVVTGPFGTQLAANEYVDGGVPIINPTHIVDGSLRPSEHESVPHGVARRLARHRLSPGDIVVGRKGDLGRAALVSENAAGWICGSDSIALRPDASETLPGFLALVLQSAYYRQQLLARSVAATMPSLNEGTLLGFRVPNIELEVQRRACVRAESSRGRVRSALAAVNRQVVLLREHRQALITAAVTGQLDLAREIAEEAS